MLTEQDEVDKDEHVVSVWRLLRLYPYELERDFWNSPECLRIYTRWDILALIYALFINFALLRAFRDNIFNASMWHFTLQFSIYLVTAALQLLQLLRHPQAHQKHRLTIIAVHRLTRIFFMCLSGLVAGPAHITTVAGTLTSSKGGTFVVRGVAWVKLLRAVLSHPLAAMAPSNFVLPVRFVVPLQLITLLSVLRMSAGHHCIVAGSQELQPLLQQTCSSIAGGIQTCTSLWVGLPLDGLASRSADICSSPSTAALQLVLYAHVILILLVPCFVLFKVEHSLKQGFVHAVRERRMSSSSGTPQQALPPAGSCRREAPGFALPTQQEVDRELQQNWLGASADCLLAVTVLIACWYACMSAVEYVPGACEAW